ncbi:sulfotransferase family protein [Mycobacterium paraseoulense]|uniref:Sulfotransferase family protein n=1 Tax=Mycobacterium paraseoulense TaxID=590652 RepID=A0A1X0I712_9MYCO|nr:sulfotransferase [Mycobacterium paraseoulense]MCV7396359.1 sulfotransferase [Mycobacterium paraseoulense]ORB36981.1 sulfotransferase family protein [Mycobacterium paraseoulense]BBZ72910.1 putative sulfotransferase [Mycobacterium paraseoulense]
MTDAVRLDDLARPRFSAEAQQILDMMATLAPDCPLDSDALHLRASADTGLDDFGPSDYRERLDVYLAALRDIDGLHGAGVVNFYGQLLQLLKNRLLLTDLLRRHPEIDDLELQPPVVIAGLPRTGTTHLHNMLAAPATFRTMPYWESVEPFPLPAEAGIEPDPRRARMDVAVGVINTVMPHFPLMHEMTTDHVHEEIQLLANDFSTMLFETLADVPRWRDYYQAHDQTPHYEYLARQLKAMQFLRGGRRWLLKSPQHLEQVPVLTRVFPGSIVVFTHRDPVPVALSMIAMITYSARMHRSPVPVQEIAASWIDRLDDMLSALVRDRDTIGAERSIDIRFDDFMANEVGVAERVYALAGEPFTGDVRTAIDDYLSGHQRGRLGNVSTSCAMFGLDEVDLRGRFAPYVERFLA